MCLGIPGRIVAIEEPEIGLATADVGGVRRKVSIQLLQEEPGGGPGIDDWVLIHVGFALAQIDEQEAAETFRRLEAMGDPYREELDELASSDIE